jgi:hypothetical protein
MAIRLASANHRDGDGDQKNDKQRESALGSVPGQTRRDQSQSCRELEARQKDHQGARQNRRQAKLTQSPARPQGINEFSGPGQKEYRSQEKSGSQQRKFHYSQHISALRVINRRDRRVRLE